MNSSSQCKTFVHCILNYTGLRFLGECHSSIWQCLALVESVWVAFEQASQVLDQLSVGHKLEIPDIYSYIDVQHVMRQVKTVLPLAMHMPAKMDVTIYEVPKCVSIVTWVMAK